ncbi:outer membrane lipoprotein carrier protein LolA [Pseudonocardia sp. WMMC193]|uniref:LolA family protein n=1 Tax=Pseudonocardia sp. WMMC193 TaxID=2911965 RepID=UPI001F2A39DF|nr:outer membrane lipoprotein carrier protein LolA [Pseudonocardia sp. WMMC193]MCF7551174.1 outer membrane lipoprotein carrier protein LolA [Pseudonocardia sp. WMMC193]
MRTKLWARIGSGVAVAGVVGLGLVAIPAGAGAQPELPPVSAEELVASVGQTSPGPFGGTVEVDNALGLPAIPGAPAQLANGTSDVRIWSDGTGRGRVSLPSAQGERTLVSDGTTAWAYDSEDRTAVRKPVTAHEVQPADPTRSATDAIAQLRRTSTVSVDGTAEVAGRPAYELVLTPNPTERTLLREVRIAVDAEKRVPLRLTVLANGSPDPAFEVGFTDLTFGPQDPALFTFTPPPGTTVTDAPEGTGEKPQRPEGVQPTVVGDGWDTVVVARAPQGDRSQQRPEGAPDLSQLGTPVSGPWGSGRLISTAVASAIVTDDGRIAAGAVPEQVLTEALAR